MDSPLIDDDHIIALLRKDAERGRLGSSFTAEKRDKNAPKPNTRFLRNLVRDADSHNAALLAKEKAETRARLRGLESGAKRGREDDGNRGDDSLKRQRRGEEREGRWKGVLSGLGKSSTRERDSEKRRDTHHKSGDYRARHSVATTDLKDSSHESKRSHHRRRSRSPDSRSRSPRHRDRSDRDRDHDRKPHNRPRSREPKDSRSHRRNRDNSSRSPDRRRRRERERGRERRTPNAETTKPTHDSDSSDPLSPLLGPAPAPSSRPRGRGAASSARNTIDLRFNDPTYDPRTDVGLSDSEEGGKDPNDPWSTSLEALRDRAAWRAKGAERLREVGFGEGDVAKFESGGRLLEKGREKDERDLKWRSKGEGREWDAGKTVGGEQDDGDGEVRGKAAWTKGIGLGL